MIFMAGSDHRSSHNHSYGTNSGRRAPMPGERFLSAIILGIFILIAAGIVAGKLSEIKETLTDTNFSDNNSFTAPSNITSSDKMYYSTDEAAAYLHMTADEIKTLIKNGEIDEYIETGDGYVIAKTVLDAWFENAAYQVKIGSEKTED
jgi:excisionase family DNA binding protein